MLPTFSEAEADANLEPTVSEAESVADLESTVSEAESNTNLAPMVSEAEAEANLDRTVFAVPPTAVDPQFSKPLELLAKQKQSAPAPRSCLKGSRASHLPAFTTTPNSPPNQQWLGPARSGRPPPPRWVRHQGTGRTARSYVGGARRKSHRCLRHQSTSRTVKTTIGQRDHAVGISGGSSSSPGASYEVSRWFYLPSMERATLTFLLAFRTGQRPTSPLIVSPG